MAESGPVLWNAQKKKILTLVWVQKKRNKGGLDGLRL